MSIAPHFLTPRVSRTLTKTGLALLAMAASACESTAPSRGHVRLAPTHHSIVYGRVSDGQHRAIPDVPIYPGLGWGGPGPPGVTAPAIVSVQPSTVVSGPDGSFRFVLQLNLRQPLPPDLRADIIVARPPRHLNLGGALVFIPLGQPVNEAIESTRVDVVLQPPVW